MKKLLLTVSAIASAFLCQATDFTDIVGRIVAADATINASTLRISADSIAALTDNQLPDPEISGEALFGKYDNKYNAGISQSFDWPGLYGARRQSALANAAAAHAETEIARENASIEVASLLTRIAADRQRIALCSRILDDLNMLVGKYRKMLADGNITVIDLNKLLIEIADYGQSVADWQRDLTDATDALRAKAPGLDIDALTAGINDFPAVRLAGPDECIEGIMANSAATRAVAARQEADRANLKVARMSGRPGFSLGYRYANEESNSYNGFGLSMTLPVFSNRHNTEAARAAALATDTESLATAASLRAELTATYRRAQTLKDRIAVYGEAVTATDNLAILKRSFDAGQTTLTDYVTDSRYFIEAELRLIDLRSDYTDAALSLLLRSH